jgi:hypothetical protein
MFKPLVIDTQALNTRAPSNLPAIGVRSTGERPAIVDHAADFDIPKLWRDRDVRGRPQSIARALTPGERSVVERRRDELRAACLPFLPRERDSVVVAISRMFGGFGALRHEDDEAAVARLDGLLYVLAPFPLWAIETVCLSISNHEAVLDGERLSRKYPPNDSEVCALTKELLRPYARALENASALLAAPIQAR